MSARIQIWASYFDYGLLRCVFTEDKHVIPAKLRFANELFDCGEGLQVPGRTDGVILATAVGSDGPLKLDGMAGLGTRRAVEAFQRTNTLHVTGELDAPTLQRLTPGKLASQ